MFSKAHPFTPLKAILAGVVALFVVFLLRHKANASMARDGAGVALLTRDSQDRLIETGSPKRYEDAFFSSFRPSEQRVPCSFGKASIGLLIVGLILLVIGVAALTITLGVTLSNPSSNSLQVGSRAFISGVKGDTMVDGPESSESIPTLSWTDSSGALQVAELAQSNPALRSFAINVPNGPVRGEFSVDQDGRLVEESVFSVPETRSSRATGVRKLACFIIRVTGARQCGSDGSPQDCSSSGSLNAIRNMVYAGPKNIKSFLETASRGEVTLSVGAEDIYELTVSTLSHGHGHYWAMARHILGDRMPTADHYAFWLPSNWRRGAFSGPAIGLASRPGSQSWQKSTSFEVFSHELLHNFGLHHSGAWTSSSFKQYGDISSVMSNAGHGRSYRGLTSPQLQVC